MQLSVLGVGEVCGTQNETFAKFWSFLCSSLYSGTLFVNSIHSWAPQIFNSVFCTYGDYQGSVWVLYPFAMNGILSLGSKVEQL